MENFDDFENKSYERARQVKYKITDHLHFILNFIVITVRVTAVLVQEIFINLFKLFKPDKPKDISGQLALVTGGSKQSFNKFEINKIKCLLIFRWCKWIRTSNRLTFGEGEMQHCDH